MKLHIYRNLFASASNPTRFFILTKKDKKFFHGYCPWHNGYKVRIYRMTEKEKQEWEREESCVLVQTIDVPLPSIDELDRVMEATDESI